VESVQIRLDREQLRELKDLEKEFKRSRSEVTRRAIPYFRYAGSELSAEAHKLQAVLAKRSR